jgi:hypothetical protein
MSRCIPGMNPTNTSAIAMMITPPTRWKMS